MADKTITLKRYNGTDWDILHALTTIEQVSGLRASLDSKVNSSLLGVNSGVATLNSSGKVNATQMPDYVFGGMRFVGFVNSDTTLEYLLGDVDAYIALYGGSREGCYYVAQGSVVLTDNVGGDYHSLIVEGDTSYGGSVTVNTGDWIVYSHYNDDVEPVHSWGHINNSYKDATTSAKGIVELATQSEVDAGTANKVVTADTLADRLNDFALSGHNHDSSYLGINANAVSASKLQTARTITLTGDVTGSVAFDGSGNVSIASVVTNNSHTHNTNTITNADHDGYYYNIGNDARTMFSNLDQELYSREKITYATSAPANPRIDDIWIDA